MATTYLSSIVGGVVDPRKEGLPVMCAFGGNALASSVKIFDSQFQVIGSPYNSIGFSGYAFTSGGMTAEPVIGSQSGLGGFSTQDLSSPLVFVQSLHCTDQYPMSQICTASPMGYLSFADPSTNAIAGKLRLGLSLINQVMPEGMRPRRYFTMVSNVFAEVPSLNQLNQVIDYFDLSTKAITRTLATQDGTGTAGYNERTKTLVTIHTATATSNCIATKFVSTVNLNTCKNLAEFFSNATVTEYPITVTGCDVQSFLDKVVVVGDNNWIGVSYRVGNNLNAMAFDLSGGNATPITFSSIAGTTSYGAYGDASCYTKMNLTWDGMWAIAYTGYYYRGCGLSAFIFSTTDPRRYFRISIPLTSGGGMIHPINKSGFVFMSGEAVGTSTGYLHAQWDFRNTDYANFSSSTSYLHSSLQGQGAASAAPIVANGALLNSTTVRTALACPVNCTNSIFTTVNYFPLNGKMTYEGGYL